MSRKNRTRLGIAFLIIVLLGGLSWLSVHYANLPDNLSQHETLVFGQNKLVPGSQAAIRVAVRDSADGEPLENAEINVSLQPASGGRAELVYTGQTNTSGTADVAFTVPDTPENDYTLIIETSSQLGTDRIERSVTLERDYRILLSSDKPLYQPGQIIHLRALALSTFDLVPAAAQPLEVSIADGKGNTVFRDTLTTSDYGVAAVDFQLASEVNSGPYKISAQLGNTLSEKSVTVEPYVLPQFDITINTEKSYYRPGDVVRGSVTAVYFFGKPVNDSEIQLEGFTFDFERQDAFTLQGITDEQGVYEFEFTLPDYIVGSDLEGGLGTFYLQTTITDQADHSEGKGTSLPVTQNALIIEAIPEGGAFRRSVENLLYVLTSYPDGSPAQTRLQVTIINGAQSISAETGPYGLAAIPVTPTNSWRDVQIIASDDQGNSATRTFYFEGEYQEESVLLRPEKPAYRVGDTMNLTIFTSVQSGSVYLDIIREGQTISTRALDITSGSTQLAIDLTPEMYGTLELHAYKILRSGSIARDTRLVLVDEANDLAVNFALDKEEYRPGDTAVLNLTTSGQDGSAAQSAIGLAVVDEAVFALAEQDPGFAKLYFLLEQELLQPKYELHGFSVPDLILEQPVDDPILRQAQEGAAQASLAEAAPQNVAFSLNANSREDNMARAYERQESYFTNLSYILFGLTMIVPLAVMGVTGVNLWQQKRLWRSLLWAVGVIVVLVILGVTGLLQEFLSWLDWRGEWMLILIGLLGLISYIGLAIYAWRRQDRAMRWAVGLILLFIPLFLVSAWASEWGGFYPDEAVVVTAVFIICLVPLAFLLRAIAFGQEKRRLLATAATFVALLLLTVPALAISANLGGMSMNGRGVNGIDDGIFVMEEMADIAMPTAAEMEAPMEAGAVDTTVNTQSAGGEAPRLRQFFPETLYWLPELQTDANGRAQVDVPIADSITTWRISVLASDQDGNLGSAQVGMRVFQDFFVEPDLPRFLTVGDEVSVPVSLFNYLDEAQTIEIAVDAADWFEFTADATITVDLAAAEVSVAYIPIRVTGFGDHTFTVTATGSVLSDAVQREVQVLPDGQARQDVVNGTLERATQASVLVPADAVGGTSTVTVKIYPGVVSQLVDGLSGMLREPYGCFEQTTSVNYPNVMILDYLRNTEQLSPRIDGPAERFADLGYQRLLTFETDYPGGFSFYGDPPPLDMLTAYGLMQFTDMSRVQYVDPDLLQRMSVYLLDRQIDDHWQVDSYGY
ncbi:MAG: hypothetical protein KC413_02035, partial [Anaerolineales bacterium]|nr:hypothetical protein [Anaerolineales bacterium]